MNDYEKGLWNKIKTFEFDEPGVAFCFSDRLARENGWTKHFALRAIDEYRKFMFLCCVAKRQITPSDEVDQVWHLHLTFTRSYWKNLCEGTLKQEIHHHPTKGGTAENEKFDRCYTETLALYRNYFGTDAPDDVWPSVDERFAPQRNVRVNALSHWIIRKPHRRIRIAGVVSLLVMGGIFNLQANGGRNLFSGILTMILLGVILFMAGKHGGGSGGGNSSGCATSGCGGSYSGCSSDGCGSGCGGGCGGCGS